MAGVTRLSWGLLGTARINRAVIGPIKASNYSRLAAVASRSGDKAREYAIAWGIPRHFDSYEALLADPTIDVIYNALPNSLHSEWSIKAMQSGKHVLCEKPLTTDVPAVDNIIATASQTGKVISEAFMYRHHPQTIKVKKMVTEGEVGKLLLLHGSFCYTNTRPDNPRLNPDLGGGSLWDVGCYPISYARYLCGEEPVEIYGHQVIGSSGVDVLFAGQLSFPGGMIAQFDCSFISPSKSSVEITGDKGRIIIPEPYKPGKKSRIYLERDGRQRTIDIQGTELYQGEITDMENAILHGKSTLISLMESRGNISTLIALYESARISQPVNLPYNQASRMEANR